MNALRRRARRRARRRRRRKAITFEDALKLIGFGKMQIAVLLTCGLLFMSLINETMGMAIIVPASQCDFDADAAWRAAETGSVFLGSVVSSYPWGFYSDIVGRRKVLLWSIILTNIISILSTFMTSIIPFIVMRFIVGVVVGGPASATMMYMGEFCMNKHRPIVINYMSMFIGISMIYCPGLAAPILDYDWYVPLFGDLEYRPWRLLGFIYCIPGIVATILLFLLPESPKFLLAIGKKVDAMSELDRVCQMNTGKHLKEIGITKLKQKNKREDTPAGMGVLALMWRDIKPMLHKPYVKNLSISCLCMFSLLVVVNGLGLWFTDMRNRFSLIDQTDEPLTVCGTMDQYRPVTDEIELDEFICSDSFPSFKDSIYLGAVFLIVYNVLGISLFIFPRKVVFIVTLLVSGGCGLSLIWLANDAAIRIAFILFLALPGVVTNLLGSCVVDFVPTVIRGKAMCICTIFGRLGSIAGTLVVGQMLERDCVSTLVIFAFFPFLVVVLGYFITM